MLPTTAPATTVGQPYREWGGPLTHPWLMQFAYHLEKDRQISLQPTNIRPRFRGAASFEEKPILATRMSKETPKVCKEVNLTCSKCIYEQVSSTRGGRLAVQKKHRLCFPANASCYRYSHCPPKTPLPKTLLRLHFRNFTFFVTVSFHFRHLFVTFSFHFRHFLWRGFWQGGFGGTVIRCRLLFKKLMHKETWPPESISKKPRNQYVCP